MKRSIPETLLGALVIIVAALFVSYTIKAADVSQVDGYTVMADFSGIGSLKAGDSVRISGVKVGTVEKVDLLEDTYLARVHLNIRSQYQLPYDTAALISSESLMGGQYLALEPGGDPEMIEDGGMIEYTQAPQNLEQLLGQFIFSMNDTKDDESSTQ